MLITLRGPGGISLKSFMSLHSALPILRIAQSTAYDLAKRGELPFERRVTSSGAVALLCEDTALYDWLELDGPSDQLLTCEEAAALIGCGIAEMAAWMKRGSAPVKRIGQSTFVRRNELMRLLNHKRTVAARNGSAAREPY